MDPVHEDSYVVYRRGEAGAPEDIEQPVATCSSYEDAVRAQRACGRDCDSVIRYQGDVGGGD
jgi:hypothetical protein